MKHRMVIAALALLGSLLSLYLWLWKIGFLGGIACGSGSCESVQLSEHAVIVGIPVAFFGVVGYVSLFAISMAGLRPRWIDSPGPTVVLAVLSGIGVGFTVYLTYLEAFVIHAWCRWCLASAAIITATFVASVIGLRTGEGLAGGQP